MEKMDGYKALIFQHCCDHLNGRTFFHPEVSKGRLSLEVNHESFERTNFLIKQYNLRVKNGISQDILKEEKFLKTIQDY